MKYYNYIIHYDDGQTSSDILKCTERVNLQNIDKDKFLHLHFGDNRKDCSTLVINPAHITFIEEFVTEEE